MKDRSIRLTYVLLIFIIVLPVFIFFSVFNYSAITRLFDDSSLIAVEQSKLNLTEHIVMTEKSHELVSQQYHKLLLDASKVYKEEYERLKDIDKIDYQKIKSAYNNLLDLYVIDSNAVIVKSTYPDALGLDFKTISLDFTKTLENIRLGGETIISRVTKDLTSGNLRKWSYIPTSDHKYILELGLNDKELSKYVKGIDYKQLISQTKRVNPLLKDIHIYSASFIDLATQNPVQDPKLKKIIENVLTTRHSYMEYDSTGTLIREFFYISSLANILDDSQKVISISYDYSDYFSYLKKSFNNIIVIFSLYTVFTLAVISMVTQRVVTEPLRELSKQMKRFTRTRKYSKIEIRKKDEIGDVVEAYNNLVDELQTTSESRTYYKKKSYTDQLTGLHNRFYIMDNFQKFCVEQREQGNAFSVVFWDIDYFKKINDTYGHPIGDEVLKNIANILFNLVGDDGVVARYGGEEFVGIISLKNQDVVNLAETIRVLVEQEKQTERQIPITISTGIAFYNEIARYEDNKKLIPIADKRLYIAKKNGRNTIVYPEL